MTAYLHCRLPQQVNATFLVRSVHRRSELPGEAGRCLCSARGCPCPESGHHPGAPLPYPIHKVNHSGINLSQQSGRYILISAPLRSSFRMARFCRSCFTSAALD